MEDEQTFLTRLYKKLQGVVDEKHLSKADDSEVDDSSEAAFLAAANRQRSVSEKQAPEHEAVLSSFFSSLLTKRQTLTTTDRIYLPSMNKQESATRPTNRRGTLPLLPRKATRKIFCRFHWYLFAHLS